MEWLVLFLILWAFFWVRSIMEDHAFKREVYQRTFHSQNTTHQNYFELGIKYHKNEDYGEAIDAFTKALAYQHGNAVDIYLKRGNVFYDIGRMDDAMNDYKRAASLDPNSGSAYLNIGDVYYQTGYYIDAIQYYEKALVTGYKPNIIYDHLGGAYLSLFRYHDAVKYFLKALEIKSNQGATHFRLSNIYSIQFKDGKNAIKHLREAIKSDYKYKQLAIENIGLFDIIKNDKEFQDLIN